MTKEHPKFDFNEALEQLKAGKPISGKDGILTSLIKDLTALFHSDHYSLYSPDIIFLKRRNYHFSLFNQLLFIINIL